MFQELLSCSSAPAWIMVSRLNHNTLPIHIVLPVHLVSGGYSDGVMYCGENDRQQWFCPWGSTVVDDVAPNFRSLMEDIFHLAIQRPSSSAATMQDDFLVKAETTKKRIDDGLCQLLKNMEDSWFGSTFKYVLLGELVNCEIINTTCEELATEFKDKDIDIDSSTLKVVVLGMLKFGHKGGTNIDVLKFCLKKGFFFNDAREEHCADVLRDLVSKLHKAVKKIKSSTGVRSKTIILVPDFDVQMLPWEHLPTLRNQEVYRMPSVWSILAAYKNERKINPLFAYYLVNPGGNLPSVINFEKLFKDNKLEGVIGLAPPAEELAKALESRDLYIYVGHGSGSKYISNHMIEKLQKCAGAVLCGCSSASLRLDGIYIPRGAPFSYLLAGSPFVFGHLWEVLQLEAEKHAYELLVSWFKDRSYRSDCDQRRIKPVTSAVGFLTMFVMEFQQNSEELLQDQPLS